MFRKTSKDILALEKQLYFFFNGSEVTIEEIIKDIKPDDIVWLKALFKAKICHIIVFEIILRYNKDEAISLLFDYYLSKNINLHDHPADQVNSLDVLFSKITYIYGNDEMKNIFFSNQFDPKKKKDRKVLRAIKFALDLDDDQLPYWLH